MKHSFLCFIVLNFLFITSILGQNGFCGFDKIYQQSLKNYANAKKVAAVNQAISNFRNSSIARSVLGNKAALNATYQVPVVVHVINKGGAIGAADNPSDAQIQGMIDFLNNVWGASSSVYPTEGNGGVNIPIRFALAKRDPDCNPTSGIIRVNGSGVAGYSQNGVDYIPGNGATDDEIKALSRWSNMIYYNIWIVWQINGAAAYAYFPSGDANEWDGTVIESDYINSSSYVLSHEMGHAFGLYHTFNGGNISVCPPNGNCNTDNDKVCDTDPVENLLLTYPCPLPTENNPCTSLPYGTIQYNFMGYGHCLNRFTAGQRDRVMATALSSRSSLLSSNGAISPTGSSKVVGVNCISATNSNPTNLRNSGPCNVTLNNMQYSSLGYNNDGNQAYIDNSCFLGTELLSNQDYVLSVSTQTNAQRVKVWIDFNNNGVFETSELVMNDYNASADYAHTVTLSKSLLSGSFSKNQNIRMRISADFGNGDFDACTQLKYGQTEDFYVHIKESTTVPVIFGPITAVETNGQITLNWATETENNNDHFDVEVSKDGKLFKTVKTVISKAQDGNSGQKLYYSVILQQDNVAIAFAGIACMLLVSMVAFPGKPKSRVFLLITIVSLLAAAACNKSITEAKFGDGEAGIKFIRIAQVDKNGAKTYSKVAKVVKE